MSATGNRSIDLTGQRFGRLVVLADSGKRTNKKIVWRCLCDCGIEVLVRSSHLIGGLIVSCKCFAREVASRVNQTHGLSNDRVYAVWRAMCQRCINPNDGNWINYGGRGITVYSQWLGPGGFEQFIADVGWPPTVDHTIERHDNNDGYNPINCLWITSAQQARNKRNSRYITHNGVTKLLLDWADTVGIAYKELHRRIVSRGWPVDKAFTTPVKHPNNRDPRPCSSQMHKSWPR